MQVAGQWRMPNRVRMLTVPEPDRVKLERRGRDPGAQGRGAEGARVVLLAAEGLTGPQIAERVGCTEPTVIKWRRQYAEDGLAGLEDAPRPGGPETVLTEEATSMILSATVSPPPRGWKQGALTSSPCTCIRPRTPSWSASTRSPSARP